MKFLKLFIAAAMIFSVAACSQKSKTQIGEIDASEIDVGAKVPGRLAEVFVSEGESVKKGQILARLEGKELDAKLKTVNAALQEAQDQYDLAEKTYNRMKNLYAQKVIAKQQFDEITYKYNAAKQKVQAVRGQKDEVMAYYAELTLTAPIDGEVIQIISNPGELVSTGYPILTIMNTQNMWAVFNIREDDLKNIIKGKTFEVTVPALDKKYAMKVTYISALGTFASWKPTARQGDYDLKTFEVRLTPDEKIENLRPAMTATFTAK
ncbi:HlyD family secretion protein [Endomicrobium proavitum]|uniref:Putative 36 kDa antigen n=1 Tax=Endomicrobium proavitum TaxID=1408281 RepID=A0A0G3WKD3_9BACT|nr:efflux RND transporter periplasmic adaptor subunit [Endomicrobium proavitum]AKL98360.1 putative 36 kDa antigen [Endomicrobium proavitum]